MPQCYGMVWPSIFQYFAAVHFRSILFLMNMTFNVNRIKIDETSACTLTALIVFVHFNILSFWVLELLGVGAFEQLYIHPSIRYLNIWTFEHLGHYSMHLRTTSSIVSQPS